ncbi:molybdopterin-binding protein [Rugosimonospora acidiphila]|uniref:Molybdopterin molybdenumtransferase n=1 Tax=Rugosimonospora acidiphila TaxID=556531 RepID=A0ABP9S107_9ACTN
MTAQPSTANPPGQTGPLPWARARAAAYAAGVEAAAPPVEVPLADADGATLANPLLTRTDLPAFPTSSVDGYAVRGDGPWRVVGRVLAGTMPKPLTEDGTCVEIATGAAVPEGTAAIVRTEDADRTQDGRVSGVPRGMPEWREPGEEARLGEQLLPAGTPVNPAVIGLAASCGYDTLAVRAAPTTAVLVFGDELLTAGLPGDGRVRDSLGPSVPAWLRRLGAAAGPVLGPVEDTLDAHVEALNRALTGGAELICTTGGTMSGPVDHLHPALAQLGARYLVNTVEVRPGFPMLLASVPRPGGGTALVAGLPGNPQSAIVALVSLVAPAVAGMSGRPMPPLPNIRLTGPVGGRGGYTHLVLVDADGVAVSHAASSMLRGMAGAVGFAVIPPNGQASAGDEVPLVPLPLLAGERP